jgi:hypothetical protein
MVRGIFMTTMMAIEVEALAVTGQPQGGRREEA